MPAAERDVCALRAIVCVEHRPCTLVAKCVPAELYAHQVVQAPFGQHDESVAWRVLKRVLKRMLKRMAQPGCRIHGMPVPPS